MRNKVKLAVGGALLLLSTAAFASPPAGAVGSGPSSLYYRMMWLNDILATHGAVRSCQWHNSCD